MPEGFDIFKNASNELLSWLLRNGVIEEWPSGSILIYEAQVGQDIIILREGKMSVTTTNEKKQQIKLSEIRPGGIAGEMSWLEKRPAVATVSAMEECDVLRIKQSQLNLLNSVHALEFHQLLSMKLAMQLTSQNNYIHKHEGGTVSIESMRKVFTFFAHLEDEDVYKIAQIGKLVSLNSNDTLLYQGQEVLAMYLILAGQLDIYTKIEKIEKKIGSSSRGELIGEITFSIPGTVGASAKVVCDRDGAELLEIKKELLMNLLMQDLDFGIRFYRALSCTISQRNRDQLLSIQLANKGGAMSSKELDAQQIDQISLTELACVSKAGRRFQSLCEQFKTPNSLSK